MKGGACSVCGSAKFVQVWKRRRMLCGKHRHQMIRWGHTESLSRGNEIRIDKDVAFVQLRNRRAGGRRRRVIAQALVDASMVPKIRQLTWCLGNHGYAITGPRKGTRQLHRFIFGKRNKLVDHINGNRLDNRRCNIRLVTAQQSAYNRNVQSNNKLGVMGVCFNKEKRRFDAEIKFAGKKIRLGHFKTFEEAKSARRSAEEKYFGKFRRGGSS